MVKKHKLLKGTPISPGIVLGEVRLILPGAIKIPELIIPASRINNELTALEDAVNATLDELRELRDSAGKKMGTTVAKIFDAQLMIASDQEFLKLVKNEILEKKRNAGFVYQNYVKNATLPLKNSKDEYMQQMAKDIDAVANKVLSHLTGERPKSDRFAPNTILAGKFFTPGEILSYRRQKAVGFIVAEGGKNSHMALIARALMLPVVIIDEIIANIPDLSQIIVDGSSGEVIVDPTDNDWVEYQKKKKKYGPAIIKRIKQLKFPPTTKDNKTVNIASNLSFPGPADDILSESKIPVGLYRTEFLYLAHGTFPDEETQYQFYKGIADKFRNTSVILRTFDLGYDKLAEKNFWPTEDNPALGWRGIRPMLELTNIFKTQIRAILRASTHRNLKIMLPMISVLPEIDEAKKIISQVKFSLKKQKIDFDNNIEIGVMIEVPSAAILADFIAEKVDFLSIGTNDLTQYTLAVDRINNKVAGLYSPLHPAVLNLIKLTVDAGKKHNKPVSICGEIAGDLLALPLFIGMGVNVLSMNPNKIFDLCRVIKKIDSYSCEIFMESILNSKSTKEVIKKLTNFNEAFGNKKQI